MRKNQNTSRIPENLLYTTGKLINLLCTIHMRGFFWYIYDYIYYMKISCNALLTVWTHKYIVSKKMSEHNNMQYDGGSIQYAHLCIFLIPKIQNSSRELEFFFFKSTKFTYVLYNVGICTLYKYILWHLL